MSHEGGTGPLSDITVLDVGHVVAGPYAALILADLGAEVWKIERPGVGDHMRIAGETGEAIFTALNRDKRSVTLDLTREEGKLAFAELAAQADVVIENFGPGAMEKLDLGYEDLRVDNPNLVYVSLKGYANGPYADRPATDPIAEAMSGLMNVTGHEDAGPARAGTSVADIAAASNAVIATLVALMERESHGGQHVTVPIFESSVSLMGYWLAYRQLFDQEPTRHGASHPLYAPYNAYPTVDDRYVFIGATNDEHWEKLKGLLEIDLGFESRQEREERRDVVDEAVASRTVEWTQANLVGALLAEGIPAAPVNETKAVLEDQHLQQVGAFTEIERETDSASESPLKLPLLPIWSNAYEVTGGKAPPSLGADTNSVLDSLGLSESEIAAAQGDVQEE